MLEASLAASLAQPQGQWQYLPPVLLNLLPLLAQAVVVALITFWLARWSHASFLRATERSRAAVHTRFLVARLLSLAVVVVGVGTILVIVGVEPAAVVTVLGVVGLGISLALQDILRNLFAGLYLLFERPFRIGDEIRVRDFIGRVEDVGIRTTSIRTLENVQIVIPNALVFTEVVQNRTHVWPQPVEPSQQPGGGEPQPGGGKR